MRKQKNQPKEMGKIIHGLDLPDDISEKNNEIIMKQLGITEDDILAGMDEINASDGDLDLLGGE